MKNRRQLKILEIIQEYPVDTQEKLLERLKEAGFAVTQATVSRDMKQLRLTKVLDKSGRYRYSALSQEAAPLSSRLDSLFAQAVTGVDFAGNIVVVKCLSGMAQAACAALDTQPREDILGTLAGEDTFICIVRNEEKAAALAAALTELIRAGG